MALDPAARRSRRALLVSAVGGAAAVAATQLAKPAAVLGADPDDVVKNTDNATTALTSIIQATTGVDAFAGAAPDGIGVRGAVTGTAAPTWAGVVGTSGDITGSALEGATSEEPLDAGVYGFAAQSDISTGVWGECSGAGYAGVFGTGPTGVEGNGYWGVAGFGDSSSATSVGGLFAGTGRGVVGLSTTGTAMHAHVGTGAIPAAAANTALLGSVTSTTQIGLEARGRVRFPNRSGRVKMLKNRSYQDFAVSGVTSSNYAFASLATYRSGRWVAAVVCYTGKIRVYLNTRLTADTFVYWVVLG
jgi:hypothetical protein